MKTVVDHALMRLAEERSNLSSEDLMNLVGKGIKNFCSPLLHEGRTLLLLAGSGNNAGDGYTALTLLQEEGFSVVSWQIGEVTEGSLLQKKKSQFEVRGGRVISYPEMPRIDGPLLILDGIYGTGFHGVCDEASSSAIAWANKTHGIIVSIDVPSGIDASTGLCEGEAIFADTTLFCKFPKLGCFLGNGWEHTGRLVGLDLPLEAPSSDLVLLEAEDISELLPLYKRAQNKYDAGSVIALTGSRGMMGASSLACEAAYRVGAGYVRALLQEGLEEELSILPKEVVKTILSPEEIKNVRKYLEFSKSALIGPGLGRGLSSDLYFQSFWPLLTMPTVVDADALFFLAKYPQKSYKNKVLTPHHKEAERLFQRAIPTVDFSLISHMRRFSDATEGTIVLKGSPTFLFHPEKPTLIMPRGDPGMATAGSGDVLTGMIAGFLAQGVSPLSAASLASWIHGIAGEEGARKKTSYSLMASMLLDEIPTCLRSLIDEGAHGAIRNCMPFGRAILSPIEDHLEMKS